jgi:homocitrate synthase NifV
MIKLTDKTLTVLNTTECPLDILIEFYLLLLQAGPDELEMDLSTAQRLGSALLPERTVIWLNHPAQPTPGILKRACHISDLAVSPPPLYEIRLNDIREISLLGRYQGYGKLRITGLSDLMLHDFTSSFQQIRNRLSIPPELCPVNGYGCAAAILTEWLMDGGSGVCSFMGIGGYAPTEEVVMALRLSKRHKPRLDLSILPRLCHLFSELSGMTIPAHKAVIGDSVFDVESGIHVDGILKNTSNYEPFSPEVVGAQRHIIIGKHSGLGSLSHKLSELGGEVSEERLPFLLEMVRQEASHRCRSLSDEEVLALAGKGRKKC